MPVFDFHRVAWTAPRGLARKGTAARAPGRASCCASCRAPCCASRRVPARLPRRVRVRTCLVLSLLVCMGSTAWSNAACAESHRHLHHPTRHDVASAPPPAKRVQHVPRADAVRICVASLTQEVRRNRRYDRLLQLDSDLLRAQVDVQQHGAVFSIAQPVPIEATVTLRGSARTRGQWKWQPVTTRCGLRAGRVVTTSIEPRTAPARPTAKQPRRPAIDYFNYVDNAERSSPQV